MTPVFASRAVLCAAVLLGGCMHSAPEFERNFGAAARANVASQVANPGAGANRDPVAGTDGRSARAAYLNYQASQNAPSASPPVLSGSGAK